jgi:dUTP pyrophosphatase
MTSSDFEKLIASTFSGVNASDDAPLDVSGLPHALRQLEQMGLFGADNVDLRTANPDVTDSSASATNHDYQLPEEEGSDISRSALLDDLIEPLPSEVRAGIDDLLPEDALECTYANVCLLRADMSDLYGESEQYDDDVGWDLYFPEDVTIPANGFAKISLGVSAACFEDRECTMPTGFWLMPRSSISNTPLRMANSVGLIDPGYRGELIVAVDNRSNEPFTVTRGMRLFQLVGPTMKPFHIEFVRSLSETERGSNGFGSTDNPPSQIISDDVCETEGGAVLDSELTREESGDNAPLTTTPSITD